MCSLVFPRFVGSVSGATIIISITGFSWGITQWAPFALVGLLFHLHYFLFFNEITGDQLAETILNTSSSSTDPFDDTQTILLADHRTPVQSTEELFAVADDDENDDENSTVGRSPSPMPRSKNTAWSDDEDNDADASLDELGARHGLLANDHARQSWVNVGDITDQTDSGSGQNPDPRQGLSAKAGIILVRALTFLSLWTN
jgi:solute carrier family 45, member 1/2/4